jgi:hypothetical protein
MTETTTQFVQVEGDADDTPATTLTTTPPPEEPGRQIVTRHCGIETRDFDMLVSVRAAFPLTDEAAAIVREMLTASVAFLTGYLQQPLTDHERAATPTPEPAHAR